MSYAARNLGSITVPGRPCAGFPIMCTSRFTAQTVIGKYRVSVTNPVPTGDGLMRADTPGGDIGQISSVQDGDPCDRVGVEINLRRVTIFAGIVGLSENSTTVHSVARYVPATGTGVDLPALAALSPNIRCAVDAGNGTIRAFAAGSRPGIIIADSDGSAPVACAQGNANSSSVFKVNTGTLEAQQVSTAIKGTLGYLASASVPFRAGSGTITGTQVPRNKPITRAPVDKQFHCSGLAPVPVDCTTGSAGTDKINKLDALYGGSGAPPGFTVFPDLTATPAQSCGGPYPIFATGNWYINCLPLGLSGTMTFTGGGVIIFAGDIDLTGTLNVNTSNANLDTTIVVRGIGGITTGSGGWSVDLKRTFVYMGNTLCRTDRSRCGRLNIHGGGGTWTAPPSGTFAKLIFWSETSQNQVFQGNPLFTWVGVFFTPNSLFEIRGNAQVDAQLVQLWVSRAQVQNSSAYLYLRPDPDYSFSESGPSSQLIR